MNTEKVLCLLNEIKGDGDDVNWMAYAKLHRYVTEALHLEIANRRGGKLEETRIRAALAYLKADKTGHWEKSWHGHSWIKDGYQTFANSYSAYRFAEGHYIEGLPQIAPGECSLPNTDGVFSQITSMTSEATVNKKDIEIAIATWKAEGKPGKCPCYSVGVGYYDANILLEALKILGVEKATIKQREAEPYHMEGISAPRYHCYPGHLVIEGREAAIVPLNPTEINNSKEETQCTH